MVFNSLSPRAVRSGMTFSILNAACSSSAVVFMGGAVLSGMLLALNFSNVEIGILMSIPLFCLPFQVVGAMVQQRFFNRKRFWICCGLIYYAGYLAIAGLVAGWHKFPEGEGVAAFMLVFGVMSMVVQLPASIWLSWMGDVIPPRETNAYWTRRQAASLLMCSVTFLAAGWLADHLGNNRTSTYILLSVIGAVLGFLCVYFQARVPDVPPKQKQVTALATQLRLIWRNNQLRTIILFFALQSLVQNFSVPFIYVYMKSDRPGDGMGYSLLIMQFMFALSNVVGFVSGYFFRLAADRYGRKPVLIFCFALKVVEFMLYGLLIPQTGFYVAIPLFSLGGFVNMGIISCQLSLLSSTGHRRIHGVAVGLFYSLSGLFGFVGSFASGYLYDLIAAWQQQYDLGFLSVLSPFNLLSFLTALLLIFVIPVLFAFREEGARTTRTLVRNLFSNANPIRAVYYAYAINRPQTERRRIDLLQKAEGDLVSISVLNDLASPSTEVREATLAMIARSQIELSDAVLRELIHLLNTPELGNQVTAARVLGRRRVREALPELIKFFRDQDIALAQAGIYAAGLINDRGAEAELINVLSHPRYAILWAGAAESLGHLGDYRHVRLLYRTYVAEHHWVSRRQVLIAVCRSVTRHPEQIFSDFETEEQSRGQTLESQLRLILPRLGAETELEELLQEYDRNQSAAMLEKLLIKALPRYGVVPGPNGLDSLFSPGGQLLHNEKFDGETFEATVLWLLPHLWRELRYSESPDPALLPAALLCLNALLKQGTARPR